MKSPIKSATGGMNHGPVPSTLGISQLLNQVIKPAELRGRGHDFAGWIHEAYQVRTARI